MHRAPGRSFICPEYTEGCLQSANTRGGSRGVVYSRMDGRILLHAFGFATPSAPARGKGPVRENVKIETAPSGIRLIAPREILLQLALLNMNHHFRYSNGKSGPS